MNKLWVGALLVGAAMFLAGCDAGTPTNVEQAQTQVAANQATRNIYVMKNDTEFKNYNKRQEISDDPTTILWCTAAFPIPSSPMFTVPIVGKLTSAGKRPYPTSRAYAENSSSTTNSLEVAGPDGMYGQSGGYRYGFTPTGQYADFYGLATFCTTEPMVWQRTDTKLVMEVDPTLAAAQAKARELLRKASQDPMNKADYENQARQILQNAIGAGK